MIMYAKKDYSLLSNIHSLDNSQKLLYAYYKELEPAHPLVSYNLALVESELDVEYLDSMNKEEILEFIANYRMGESTLKI